MWAGRTVLQLTDRKGLNRVDELIGRLAFERVLLIEGEIKAVLLAARRRRLKGGSDEG